MGGGRNPPLIPKRTPTLIELGTRQLLEKQLPEIAFVSVSCLARVRNDLRFLLLFFAGVERLSNIQEDRYELGTRYATWS